MSSSRVLFTTALMLASAAAFGGVYRWVDTEGHVHYTDKAVPNSEPVNIRTGHVNEVVTPPPAESTGTPDQVGQKKSDCEAAKKKFESYRTATKIVETDSLGRKHEYTADEQKLLLDKAQKDAKDACGSSFVSSSSPATP